MRYHGNRSTNGNAPTALVALSALAALAAPSLTVPPQHPHRLQLCGSALNVDFSLHPRRRYAASDTGSTQWGRWCRMLDAGSLPMPRRRGAAPKAKSTSTSTASDAAHPAGPVGNLGLTGFSLVCWPESAECRIPIPIRMLMCFK